MAPIIRLACSSKGLFQVDMFFLRYLFTATAVAAFFGAAHAADTAERQYVRLAELPGDSLHGKVGQSFAVDVDLSGGGLDEQTSGEQLNVLYRMAFNQL
ncbi:MAG: hypothetical protein KUL81_00775, partial [Azonexus sp.]|nr:hypothetical protein [Azonexus sp.]